MTTYTENHEYSQLQCATSRAFKLLISVGKASIYAIRMSDAEKYKDG